MLYTPKISGPAKTFRRAMLAHLQGISLSAGGTPYNFFLQFFLAKKACMFFSVSVLLFALVKRLSFSCMWDFFIPYLRRKLVISYSYFSIGKIIVLVLVLFTHFKNNTQLRQSCDKIHCIPTSFWPTTPNALFMT